MRLSALVVVAALSVPAAALAQPGATHTDAPAEARDGGTATLVALGATAAGVGLALAGTRVGRPSRPAGIVSIGGGLALAIAGPSAGHVYAGEWRHALGFTALRVASAGVMVLGLAETVSCIDCTDRHPEVGIGLMVGGGIALGGLTIYDLYDAHRAARRANARSLAIAPTVLPTPDGRTATGLVVAGTF